MSEKRVFRPEKNSAGGREKTLLCRAGKGRNRIRRNHINQQEGIMNSYPLEITDLKIFYTRKLEGKTKAFCTAIFNDALIVAGISIREGCSFQK